MAGGDEGFLSRWSRLKRTDEVERKRGQGGAVAPEPEPQPPAVVAPPGDAPAAADEPAPELPDLASLTKDSDFTGFLRDNVPEELRRQALRTLWRSDPVLANLDGLNDYDEDFRAVGVVGEAVKTAWKVGKGFLDDESEDKAEVAESADAEDDDAPEAGAVDDDGEPRQA